MALQTMFSSQAVASWTVLIKVIGELTEIDRQGRTKLCISEAVKSHKMKGGGLPSRRCVDMPCTRLSVISLGSGFQNNTKTRRSIEKIVWISCLGSSDRHGCIAHVTFC
jgi:hypothetical protein